MQIGVVHALLLSCGTLFDPMDCSPPVFSVCRIFQVRILEWIAIPFSRASSWPRIEPLSPVCHASAGRVFTTVPPGKYADRREAPKYSMVDSQKILFLVGNILSPSPIPTLERMPCIFFFWTHITCLLHAYMRNGLSCSNWNKLLKEI